MSLKITPLCLLSTFFLSVFSPFPDLKAQVSSDGTLSTTVSTDDAVNFLIQNGDRSGDNLFHSFSEFSIPNLGSAYFNNATDITNIFSRVTGGNISDIQGLIRANGTANLFLINPAGIVFGENASLDVGGSFFATTAQSILFGNDVEFSATQPEEAPLLTVNITPGLQYGANPLPIDVSGSNLAVNSGQSISLLGGDVAISNSEISAPGGQINLGGLAETGTINLEQLTAVFPANISVSNVTLADAAIIDVTSTNNGNIVINAADFTLSGSSEILAGLTSGGNTADAVSGNIIINATGSTNLTQKSLIANDLQIDALGNGGNIELNTNSLSLTGGSRIQTVTNSSGVSGDINIYSDIAIIVDGFTEDGLFSGMLSRSATETAGAGGNITVNSPQNTLTLSNRGFIATVTNSNSNGGNIETNLNNLVVESGGQILTATTNLGNAGDITINATESVSISGESRDFVPNPFLDLATFDLNALEFITGFNPNVAESETIPYVSVERTPEQIVSGTTILGIAEDQVDYYSFSVTEGGSRAILDIDFGAKEEREGRIDTKVFLFNLRTGELLEVNDDSLATDGAEGSLPVFDPLSADSLIDTTLDESGFYILGVAAFPSDAVSNELIEGSNPDVGDTYTLQTSIENQGTEGVAIPVNSLNSENYNPNVEAISGLFSESSGIGNGGTLTVNTGQLIIENGGRLSADNSDVGQGGNLILNVENTTTIRDSALVSSITRGDGNAGSIVLNTGRLAQSNNGDILSNTFAFGNAGSIEITAQESVILNNTDESSEEISEILSDGLSGSTGNSGQITIETPILRVLGGSEISSAIEGEGNGGNIEILANVLEIRGRSPHGVFVSQIEGHTQSNDEEATGSTIIITAQEVSISDEGEIFARTFGAADAGNLVFETTVLQVANGGRISASTLDEGNAGNITIVTEQLKVTDEGQIGSATFGAGDGGNLTIEASESVEVLGRNEAEALASGIFVNPQLDSTGNGGNVTIETGLLRIMDGGIVTASTLGIGDGGNLSISAIDVEVSGVAVGLDGAISGLSVSVDEEGTGNGGSLTIDAESLQITNGGQVIAGSFGDGNAGDIILRVDEIEVSGISEDGEFVSRIAALSETDFAAGSVDIISNNLTVSDRAQISVSNTGTGNAGNLNINAGNIFLDTQGSLQGEVAVGDQGNINLTSQFLLLRSNSSITTNAGNQATGGNITIDTVNLVALEDSDITANAVEGQGGNIIVTAQGLFLSPDSQITASSEFGVDGIVTLNTPQEDNSAAILELPTTFTDPSQQIAQGCAWTTTSSFYVTGRGGIPQDPSAILPVNDILSDVRSSPNPPSSVVTENSSEIQSTIIEANTWIINEKGNVELVAVVTPQDPLYNSLQASCAGK